MKALSLLTICTIVVTAAIFSLKVKAQELPQLGKNSIEEIINAMTVEEKAHILIGTGMAGIGSTDPGTFKEIQKLVPGAAGTTYPIPRLGIPGIVLADGPAGLRITPKREGDSRTFYCTGFPAGSLLSDTWNTGLVEEVGEAMGNEVLEYGVDVILGPAMNIHRNPLCGRNFEYYSEDPVVTGNIAAAMVKGIQSNGVGVAIKHFAANNQETNRMNNDVRVSPRAMREIYLKGFEIAVKEAHPWAVMSSYNYINGIYASERKDLLTDILRTEWGFEGIVLSDWFGGKHTVDQIKAGNDLLQPGQDYQYEELVKAINSGRLPMEYVDICVKRILELVLRSPRFNHYKYSDKPDLKAHAKLSRESAAEGMVLLKNDGNTLPLPGDVKKIAVFGITSYDFIAGGTGSGDVNKAYTVNLIEGLENAGYCVDKTIAKVYEKNHEDKKTEQHGNESPYAMLMPKQRPDEFLPAPEMLTKAAKTEDVALITIGRTSGEFADRKIDNDFNLSEKEQSLISNVCEAFHKEDKKVIVILNIGGVIETFSWKARPDAILLAGLPGQEGGNTIADVLSGKVNPSGKLTDTYPINFEDHWSSENFPVQIPNESLRKNQVAGSDNGLLQNEIRNFDYTVYAEGIYVGYRFFEKFNVPVSFPFGYGISYSEFEYSNIFLSEKNNEYSVTVTVKNTGKYAGKEVVQLYIAAPESRFADKPVKELKAFVKTSIIKPGNSETIILKFSKATLASFNPLEQAWITDAGNYKAIVGASSSDIRAELPFRINNTEWIEKVHAAF